MSRLHPLTRASVVPCAIFQAANGLQRIVTMVRGERVYYISLKSKRGGNSKLAYFTKWAYRRQK